jgi:AraC-like DNA-binding protein
MSLARGRTPKTDRRRQPSRDADTETGFQPPSDRTACWRRAHLTPLLSAASFVIGEFRCPGTPPQTEAEAAPFPEIVMPRVGSYLRSDEAGDVLLSRGTLAFFEAGRPYTIRHFQQTPDLTTVISLTDVQSVHEALGVRLPRGRSFARSAIKMPADIALMHRQMLSALKCAAPRELAAQELAAEIILRAVALNVDDPAELARPATSRSPGDPYAQAQAVMAYLARNFAERVTLEDVAREVSLSPFHLCRIFRGATGSTIRRHLLSLRLEAAAAVLFETGKSVTEIALGVGFSSHSHFTAAFAKRFGVSPRKARMMRCEQI